MNSAENQTIKPALRVLTDARAYWQDAFDSYHDPQRFLRHVEAMIQCLRNATWRLQAVKSRFPDFEDWYSPWQEKMRANPRLTWLNDARIDITKKTGLISESYAAVSVIDSYLNAPLHIIRLPVDLSTSELVRQTVDKLPPEDRQYKTLEIRRRWISPDFPSDELLSLLGECLTYLVDLIKDAEAVLVAGANHGSSTSQSLDDLSALDVDPSEILLLVTADSLTEIRHATFPVKENIPIEVLKEKYGFDYESLKTPLDPFEKAIFFHNQAMQVFRTDGFHAGMFLLFGGQDKGEIMMFAPEDKRAKFLLARRLADTVKSKNYDLVILICESWFVQAPDDLSGYVEVEQIEGRRESLGTWMESCNGERIAYACEIIRTNGQATLGELMTITAPSMLLEPTRRVWNARRKS